MTTRRFGPSERDPEAEAAAGAAARDLEARTKALLASLQTVGASRAMVRCVGA